MLNNNNRIDLNILVALIRAVLLSYFVKVLASLLRAGVLSNSLSSLAHGVFCQFTGKQQTHGSLNFSAGDGGTAVVVCQTGSFGSDSLENVIDKGVHDAHGLAGNTCVRVYLLQHLVNVDAVALLSPPPALLVPSAGGFGLAGRFFGSFCAWLGWHIQSLRVSDGK